MRLKQGTIREIYKSVIKRTKMKVSLKEGIENYIEENYQDFANDILLADGFEGAFLGVSEVYGRKPVACYDSSKCIDILIERDGMDADEAIEHFNFNVTSAYVGEFTPAFVFPFDEEWDCTVLSEGDQDENDYLG